jgi:hypothetical protein
METTIPSMIAATKRSNPVQYLSGRVSNLKNGRFCSFETCLLTGRAVF